MVARVREEALAKGAVGAAQELQEELASLRRSADALREEQTTWSREKVQYLDRIRKQEVAATTRVEAQGRAQPADGPSLYQQWDRIVMEMLADLYRRFKVAMEAAGCGKLP